MSSTSPVELYLQSKANITSLVTEENQHTAVPACPEWTLRDLIAHLVGSFEDVMDGNVDDLGQPQWTAAQVERYAGASLNELYQRWDELIVAAGAGFEEIARLDLPDIAAHEFDVRGALGNKENRDSPILAAALPFFAGILDQGFQNASVNALEIVADNQTFKVGPGEPVGTVRATPFELTRLLTGRRSQAQMQSLNSTVALDPWLAHLAVMPPRATDLTE